MTPFERVVGDSSKDHTVTAPTFTTRPTTEQLHHYAGRHSRTVCSSVCSRRANRAAARTPNHPSRGYVGMGPITNLDELLASDRATVTVRETALVLGVDQRTITRAIAAGELPALRIGRRVL